MYLASTSLVWCLLIAGCSADIEPYSIAVGVFVDADANAEWTEGDVPLPDITIRLDDDMEAITNSEGRATFEDVTGRRHTVSLDAEAVEELKTHSLVCSEPSQRIATDEVEEVLFCFTPQGFMEVDVAEDSEGE